MFKLISSLIVFFAFALSISIPAFAAKPITSTEMVGYDVSFPQCNKRLPTNHYFGIVGVNGGTAAKTNPCLVEQLTWANKAKIGSNQQRVQLYVNTANPGEVIDQITTWPTDNIDPSGNVTNNPHGLCTGQNDLACSWQYGWDRANEAHMIRFAPAARIAGINDSAGAYIWWLDVETMNTWQSGSVEALKRNVATLEGMGAYYIAQGATVGLYSTAVQWGEITGNFIGTTSNLNGLANWRPSGSSLSNAKNNCSVDPLTSGGFISLTQYVIKNLDHNHSCI